MSVIYIRLLLLYQKCMQVLLVLRCKHTNLSIILCFRLILIHIIFIVVTKFLKYFDILNLLYKHNIDLYFKDKQKCSILNPCKMQFLMTLADNCKWIYYIILLLHLFLCYCILMEYRMFSPNLSK